MTIKEFKIQYALGTLPVEYMMKLARIKRTSKFILTALAESKNWRVRCLVASNLNTPVSMLEQLSKDKIRFVRGNVAMNLNTPKKIIKQLSKDRSRYVRKYGSMILNLKK